MNQVFSVGALRRPQERVQSLSCTMRSLPPGSLGDYLCAARLAITGLQREANSTTKRMSGAYMRQRTSRASYYHHQQQHHHHHKHHHQQRHRNHHHHHHHRRHHSYDTPLLNAGYQGNISFRRPGCSKLFPTWQLQGHMFPKLAKCRPTTARLWSISRQISPKSSERAQNCRASSSWIRSNSVELDRIRAKYFRGPRASKLGPVSTELGRCRPEFGKVSGTQGGGTIHLPGSAH